MVVKVHVHGAGKNHEVGIYDRINSTETDHPGEDLIRKLLGHLPINGPHSCHICLAHQPQGFSVDQFLSALPGRAMNLEDLKPCLRQVLGVLDFLHTEAHIIHTGKCEPASDSPHASH